MCGRYALKINIEQLIERYGITKGNLEIYPRDEIFPTEIAPVVIENKGDRLLQEFSWGFRPSFTNTPIINARGETIEKKTMFKDAFQKQRCIIPASAFFEWKKVGTKKVKYIISHKHNNIISLAGIYDTFLLANGKKIRCFSIITTSPSDEMKEIHDRMPVILEKDQEKYWLDNSFGKYEQLKEMIKPYSKKLNIKPGEKQLKFDF